MPNGLDYSCKIGTIPMLVRVHGNDLRRIKPGNWIRIKESGGQRSWSRVLVRRVNPDGYFQADR